MSASQPRVGVGLVVRRRRELLLICTGGDASTLALDELTEAAWFPSEELPEALFDPLRRLIAGDTCS